MISGRINTMRITRSNDVSIIIKKPGFYLSISDIDSPTIINNLTSQTYMAIRACLIKKMTAFIIPKLVTSDSSTFGNEVMYEIPKGYVALDVLRFICICAIQDAALVYELCGTRGRLIFGDIKMKHLLHGKQPKK